MLIEPLESRHLMAAVTGLTLVNADTDQPIGAMTDGMTIDLVAARRLSVLAAATTDTQSVRFALDASANFKTENSAPYAIAADDPKAGGGIDYKPWTPSLGNHRLSVTAHTADNASGSASAPVVVNFSVVDSSTVPNPPPPPPPTGEFGQPFTINGGGTYTGKFRSTSANTPVITIATTAPVVLENMELRGKGHLIFVKAGVKANVTIRNVRGFGENPNVNGRYPGRFLFANDFAKVDVQHNYMQGTSGMFLHGNANGATVKVLHNEALNIDGRMSNGNGGWQTPGTGGSTDKSFYRVQFFQISDCQGTGAIEVAWNKVTNIAGQSRVEDNISIHRTRPASSSTPILIHHNLIDGAYSAAWKTAKFSGGGIIVDGGWSPDRGESAYVKIYANTVLNTSNYGIAIAAGHDNQAYDNRVFSTGKVNGDVIRAANVGMYVRNHALRNGNEPPGHFYNNYVHHNLVGWIKADGGRNDYYLPDDDGSKSVANASYSGSINDALIQSERDRWLAAA